MFGLHKNIIKQTWLGIRIEISNKVWVGPEQNFYLSVIYGSAKWILMTDYYKFKISNVEDVLHPVSFKFAAKIHLLWEK